MLLRYFRRHARNTSRTLIAVLGMLWLMTAVSPCVMAQPQHDHHIPVPTTQHAGHEGMHHDGMNHRGDQPCGPVTAVDCQFQDFASPTGTATIADMAVTPVLLTTLPVPVLLPRTASAYEHTLLTPDIPAPPLHILHLALLF
jgi:hypothetical protein